MNLDLSTAEMEVVDDLPEMHPDARTMLQGSKQGTNRIWTLDGTEKEFKGLLETLSREHGLHGHKPVALLILKVEKLLAPEEAPPPRKRSRR